MEVICQLNIAFELNYVESEQYTKMRKFAEEISNKINALRNYQLNK